MLAVSVDERQHDWGIVLPDIEFASDNSVNQATDLVPNEIHTGRLPRLPLSLFDLPAVSGHQCMKRDQLVYYNLAVDRQRYGYSLVREYRRSKFVKIHSNPPVFEVGNWVWVYSNSAATIRQEAIKSTVNLVLKAKFSLPLTIPSQILAVGLAPASNTPDDHPLERNRLYLDLPIDTQDPGSRPRVSVLRCKACRNPYDTEDAPTCLPADFSKSPPLHVTPEDVSSSTDHYEVDRISGHQLVRGRGGYRI